MYLTINQEIIKLFCPLEDIQWACVVMLGWISGYMGLDQKLGAFIAQQHPSQNHPQIYPKHQAISCSSISSSLDTSR
jgi:hypothetical protein